MGVLGWVVTPRLAGPLLHTSRIKSRWSHQAELGVPALRSAPESAVRGRTQPLLGPLGTWRFSPRASRGASLTRAGDEAGTLVLRLFSCERTAAREPAFRARGSARIPGRESPIFISLSSLFASLAFRFAVSSSPPFLPAGPWKGGLRSQLTKAAGGEGRSGRGVCGGGVVSSARRGSSGACGRDSRAPGWRGWPRPGGRWVGSERFLPWRSSAPHTLSLRLESCA